MNAKSICRLGLLLPLFSVAMSGCATKILWTESTKWNSPDRSPNLRLFQNARHDDFLVVYSELSERRDAIQPRAYFLWENQARVDHNQPPRFSDPTNAIGLVVVPIYFPGNAPALSLGPFPRAVAATNAQSFALISGGKIVGSYWLPVYKDGSDYAKRIALTPLAAVADVSIVGGAIVYWTWPLAGQVAQTFVNK